MQCVAVRCIVVQCVLQCVAVLSHILTVGNGCIFISMCCSALQCVAVCCSVLQCVAVCCSVLHVNRIHDKPKGNVLQCVAVCCSVLQCVAVCCSVLQCVAGTSQDLGGFIKHFITCEYHSSTPSGCSATPCHPLLPHYRTTSQPLASHLSEQCSHI